VKSEARRKMFFFEKKNQKTFVPLRTLPARRAPTVTSFLLLFFKKEDLPSLTEQTRHLCVQRPTAQDQPPWPITP
jgi:hypothetical protein